MQFLSSPQEARRYFDHGATSFPRPAVVGQAMVRFLDEVGGPYGRSGHHRAIESSRVVFETRELLAECLGVPDSSRLVFTSGATLGLNLALASLTRPRATVLVCPLSHNAVMRPLERLRKSLGARIEILPHGRDGRIDIEAVHPPVNTCAAVVTAMSNVNGVLQPVVELKQRLGTIPLIVDAAQVAGLEDLRQAARVADVVALTGHKSLLGPPGTGALYVRPHLELEPLVLGGTGSHSDSFDPPSSMPDRLEAGTPNTVGIAGLGAALRFSMEHGEGVASSLALRALEALRQLPEITVLSAEDAEHQAGLFSFNLANSSPSATATLLEERHGLAVRAGLHCAPLAHRTLGSFQGGGAVRVSFGRFHDEQAVALLVGAVKELAQTADRA